MKTKTPELDKMLKVKDKSQSIGEFLEWLQNEKGIILCILDDERYTPIHLSMEKLLASYFHINLDKCEKERILLLEEVRRNNP